MARSPTSGTYEGRSDIIVLELPLELEFIEAAKVPSQTACNLMQSSLAKVLFDVFNQASTGASLLEVIF